MQVKQFVFNPFQVNSFILYDETGDCIIIDPACSEEYEYRSINNFINENKLIPKALLNTHGHVDHICGNNYFKDRYNLPVLMHESDSYLIDAAVQYGNIFGFYIKQPPAPNGFLKDNENYKFGNSSLEIIHAPGHSPGSILFYSKVNNFLIAGDVIFSGSIGRTDLPKGNFETLINSIKTKIMILPEDTKVYPGHGSSTTIGKEKKTNPFLQ